ncbi:MAG: hypothetical protein H0T52_07905 [Lautropia sp.]|nr:hypothetical protein [Lautropia sp.]
MTDTPRLFGAQAVVQHANALTQLVEQPNGLQGRYIDRWCRPEGRAVRRLANDGGQHGGLHLAAPQTVQAVGNRRGF